MTIRRIVAAGVLLAASMSAALAADQAPAKDAKDFLADVISASRSYSDQIAANCAYQSNTLIAKLQSEIAELKAAAAEKKPEAPAAQ